MSEPLPGCEEEMQGNYWSLSYVFDIKNILMNYAQYIKKKNRGIVN